MTCQISLGPDNDLELITPHGRRVYIPIGPHSTKMLFDVLWHASSKREAPGFVNGYPTQAIINVWKQQLRSPEQLAEEAALKEEKAAAAKAAKKQQVLDTYGVNLDDLEF